jgi:hypothetical protein
LGLPLSRFSLSEIQREVLAQGIVADISGTTLWRWLRADALCPRRYRSWIFPRHPEFLEKAGRILDLCQRRWNGKPLHTSDFVICADEKTSIQAGCRRHPSLPPLAGRSMRVEHEYRRAGAWAYLAAGDVHRAKLFGRCEAKTGIAPVDRWVGQGRKQEPYRSARRVFWIMDNGSAHRGQKAAHRLRSRWPSVLLVHTPLHASGRNQIEIYFSIVQRKVLTRHDFSSLTEFSTACLPSSIAPNRSPLPFSGPLPGKTSRPSWQSWTSRPRPAPPEPPIRHHNSESEY